MGPDPRTTQGVDAPQLSASSGRPLERSLFLPIYAGDLNDSERKFALYLDRDAAVRWWHRNGMMRGSYGLRGWRRGNVYPDFLFAALREPGARERIVVIETKGEQLEGNRDTKYKRALLAVVLFEEIDVRLPALIQGGANAQAVAR